MTRTECDEILKKRLAGKRLNADEGLALFSCGLLELGMAAQKVTPRVSPRAVTFIVDRNISYTNVCTIGCDFCAFHCLPGSSEAFVLPLDSILRKVQELAEDGGTQVLIQGGIHPDLGLDDYLKIVRAIHEKFPQIQIHSFSAIEMDVLSKKSGVKLPDLFRMFKEAGLNSLPGGGAEILVERVRQQISPGKISSERWLEVMRVAHEAGLRTTATMVFGHIETKEERIVHLLKLRKLQDQTRGFRSLIPWSLIATNTAMQGIRLTGGDDYLRTVAISRLMLDNIEHIQAGWLTEGMKLAQIALAFGCDDMGGTLMEDKVLEPTGIKVATRREDLIRLVRDAGFVPVQRNTDYEMLESFGESDGTIHEVKIEPVLDSLQRAEVARLASLIWRECYAGMVPSGQIDFMLENFQSEQAITEQIRRGYRYFQLSRGMEMLGYFALQPRPEGRLFLSKIYLKAGERRKGYGRKMMTFIEGWAGREGYSEVTLTVNKKNDGAIRAYRNMGFRIVESVVQDIGGGFVMDDYRMARRFL